MAASGASQDTMPTPHEPIVEGDPKSKISKVWHRFLWIQWYGQHAFAVRPITAPTKPDKGFFIYCDVADNKLKAIGSGGTVTTLALP